MELGYREPPNHIKRGGKFDSDIELACLSGHYRLPPLAVNFLTVNMPPHHSQHSPWQLRLYCSFRCSVQAAKRIAILRTQKPEINSFEKGQQPLGYSFEKV